MTFYHTNAILNNKKNLYHTLVSLGYFLPNIKSKACTCAYLFFVLNERVFAIKNNRIKHHRLPNVKLTALDLMIRIDKLLAELKLKPLGLQFPNSPNKGWLLDVFFTLNPSNEVFHHPDDDRRVRVPLK
jgi:hypothetical protein